MPVSVKIWIALSIAIACVFAALWQIANVRGVKARGRRRASSSSDSHGQRASDRQALSGPEKKLYLESQRLLSQKKYAPAARILEQLNMHREAIQILEDNDLIHDAAKVLMRMQRHNRAGVIYARHGLWENAAQCFKMANMPAEVGKCAREAGDLAMAGEFFEKAQRYSEAADCYEEHGDYLRAARLFNLGGQTNRAVLAFNRAGEQSNNVGNLELDDAEIDQIIAYLGEGRADAGLAAILAKRDRLVEVILKLLGQGLGSKAAELIAFAQSDIAPVLMAEVNYQNQGASTLAEVLLGSNKYLYAGMVYERMNAFEKAAAAFEKAEEIDRAIYCYERCGMDAKAAPLKARSQHALAAQKGGVQARPAGNRAPGAPPSGAGFAAGPQHPPQHGRVDFALASVADSALATPALVPEPEPTRIEALPKTQPRKPAPLNLAPELPEQIVVPMAAHLATVPTVVSQPPAEPPPPAKKPPEAPVWTLRSEPSLKPPPDPTTNAKQEPIWSLKLEPSINLKVEALGTLASEAPAPKVPEPSFKAPSDSSASRRADAASKENTPPPMPGMRKLTPPAETPPQRSPTSVPVPAPGDIGRDEDGRAAFHKAAFCADLNFEQTHKLWNIGFTLKFKAEETILNYNDEPRGIYVVLRGAISCYRQVGGKEAYIDQMTPADTFGELWLLADTPTAVHFVAVRDTEVRVIDRQAFVKLLDKDGTIARKLYKRFAMRLLQRLLNTQTESKNPLAS